MTCETCNSLAQPAAAGHERPRYFPRQLISADDLTLEQDYFREKMRRHNRMLHGWGVVCGATLELVAQPWKVVVKSGYILGPYGDEIWIARDLCFDLRTRCTAVAAGADPCEQMDPCYDGYQVQPLAATVYVAVRYMEFKSRPVRVQYGACGCGDDPCEYSRWRDGYEICVLDDCPASHHDMVQGEFGAQPMPACPPPPADPWVILAEVALNAQGEVTRIDHCACRRQVRSLASFVSACTDPPVIRPPAPQPAPPPP